jgi:hypothetical protein
MKVRSHSLSPSVARSVAVVCAAVFVASAHTAQAGINAWTSHGPPGGDVSALAIDPITPRTIYAGTSGTGVFKSTDAGATWSAANTGLPSNTSVSALAIDPTMPRTLYAGTAAYSGPAVGNGGVYKSTDGASSWNAFNTGLTNANVGGLAIDPLEPRRVYAWTRGGVFAIEQISACVGDCNDSSAVTIDELLTMVSIALSNAQPSVCPSDLPSAARSPSRSLSQP